MERILDSPIDHGFTALVNVKFADLNHPSFLKCRRGTELAPPFLQQPNEGLFECANFELRASALLGDPAGNGNCANIAANTFFV